MNLMRQKLIMCLSDYQTPKGYYVKDEDVEEFDKEFPPKEKLKLPGQLF